MALARDTLVDCTDAPLEPEFAKAQAAVLKLRAELVDTESFLADLVVDPDSSSALRVLAKTVTESIRRVLAETLPTEGT